MRRRRAILSHLLICTATLAAQGRAPVASTVLDADGKPLAGADVTFVSNAIPRFPNAGVADVVHARSDASGRFRARLLRGRTYATWAATIGKDHVMTSDAVEVTALQRFDLKVHRRQPKIRIELLEHARWKQPLRASLLIVSGHVVRIELPLGAAGRAELPPIPTPWCRLEVYSGPVPLLSHTLIVDRTLWKAQVALGAEGRYAACDQDNELIGHRTEKNGKHFRTRRPSGPLDAAARTVRGLGSFEVRQLALPRPVAARVLVTEWLGAPVAGVTVVAIGNAQAATLGRSGADGALRCTLPANALAVSAGRDWRFQLVVRTPGVSVMASEPSGLPDTFRIETGIGLTISGRIVTADGAALPRVAVYAQASPAMRPLAATTDAEGRFTLHGLDVAVPYQIFASVSAAQLPVLGFQTRFPVLPRLWLRANFRHAKATGFDIGDLRIDPAAVREVMVVDRRAQPVPGAALVVRIPIGYRKALDLRARTDHAGRVAVYIPKDVATNQPRLLAGSARGFGSLRLVAKPKGVARLTLTEATVVRGRVLKPDGSIGAQARVRADVDIFAPTGLVLRAAKLRFGPRAAIPDLLSDEVVRLFPQFFTVRVGRDGWFELRFPNDVGQSSVHFTADLTQLGNRMVGRVRIEPQIENLRDLRVHLEKVERVK